MCIRDRSSTAPQLTQDVLLGQPGDSIEISNGQCDIFQEQVKLTQTNSKRKTERECSKHSSSRSISDPSHNIQAKPHTLLNSSEKKKKHGRFNIISSLFTRSKR